MNSGSSLKEHQRRWRGKYLREEFSNLSNRDESVSMPRGTWQLTVLASDIISYRVHLRCIVVAIADDKIVSNFNTIQPCKLSGLTKNEMFNRLTEDFINRCISCRCRVAGARVSMKLGYRDVTVTFENRWAWKVFVSRVLSCCSVQLTF